MKTNYMKPVIFIGCLIALTCVALAYTSHDSPKNPVHNVNVQNNLITLGASLTQDKIFTGGDGKASLALTISADNVMEQDFKKNYVDMVIVLDRSGSMQGHKIEYAKKAVLALISQLGKKDRFCLVTYSSNVRKHSDLIYMNQDNYKQAVNTINQIYAGGGTNLGAGLKTGIDIFLKNQKSGNAAKNMSRNMGRLILISDGLANEGITDPTALSNMASIALEKEFAVSTVGVGNDFNEQLMTILADKGSGNYYYLENPNAFAKVFQKEFIKTQTAIAAGVEITIPLYNGMILTNASGYPFEIKDNTAVFHPGNIVSGQTKNLFLTFQFPVDKEKIFEIKDITAKYLYKDQIYSAALSDSFYIACVKSQKEVISSIKKDVWEKKVIHDDYNKLKHEVAADIKAGKDQDAMRRINEYQGKQQALNQYVKSDKVEDNLKKGINELREMITTTFSGEKEEVVQKQKKNSKALQFEAYKGQRSQE